MDYLIPLINQILTRRRQHLERRNDFIQIMVDHEESVTQEPATDKPSEQTSVYDSQLGTLKKSNKDLFSTNLLRSIFILLALNDKEILGQALIFLFAGQETVSTLLSFFFYVMATESAIQEKVYQEIVQIIGDVC